MKLALGTVQFGIEYGIANQSGRVQSHEVNQIIQQAVNNGVNTLDTAIDYGESESALGQAGVSAWNIVTKLPSVPPDCVDVAAWVRLQIEASLVRLGVSQLHGVLLHRPEQLLGENGTQLSEALQRLKLLGLTRKIGVSVYSPDALSALEDLIPLDIVQAPLNILDRRLVQSGWAKKLKLQGTELHIRSVFLQGLLLMASEQRPSKFAVFSPIWSEWSRWLNETGLTPLQASLGYVLGLTEVDKVVVGIDSLRHLDEILAASHVRLTSLPNFPHTYEKDADLINPGRWSHL
jgi:aryl-alcohol dehydrogenase-like predicted oxidoreductase